MDRKTDEEIRKKVFPAAYRIFAEKGYREANMRMLAEEAGVSKSLIFFHFRNKADLYMALWFNAAKITQEYLGRYQCDDPEASFFDTLERGLHAKAEVMRKYPDIYRFILRAYYETDSEVRPRIQESYRTAVRQCGRSFSAQFHSESFREGVDLRLLYKTILLASEGFVYQSVLNNRTDADTFEREYSLLIDFWRKQFERRV